MKIITFILITATIALANPPIAQFAELEPGQKVRGSDGSVYWIRAGEGQKKIVGTDGSYYRVYQVEGQTIISGHNGDFNYVRYKID